MATNAYTAGSSVSEVESSTESLAALFARSLYFSIRMHFGHEEAFSLQSE
jgi:hypothetical protein